VPSPLQIIDADFVRQIVTFREPLLLPKAVLTEIKAARTGRREHTAEFPTSHKTNSEYLT
jgi:hypothetical protein